MKKIQLVSIGTLLTAAAAIPFLIHKKRIERKKEKLALQINVHNTKDQAFMTDFKDREHLIFCDESQLSKRLIQLENSINIRDIGGYTGLDGKKVKWGKIIRSEELAHLSEKDLKYFENIHLKHIFDFRDDNKATIHPDPKIATAKYHHIPVLKGIHINPVDIDFTKRDAVDRFMEEIYAFQVEEKAENYAEILKMLTEKDNFPILYHCTNGKDRTGFMTALILLLLGVSEEKVISDYSLTNLTFDEAYETLGSIMLGEIQNIQSVDKEQIRDFFGVKPKWLKLQLDYISKNYKNIENYLLAKTDLKIDDIEKIRANLLEEIN